jgi:hypothetical protein
MLELDRSQSIGEDIGFMLVHRNIIDFNLIGFQMLPEPVILDSVVLRPACGIFRGVFLPGFTILAIASVYPNS